MSLFGDLLGDPADRYTKKELKLMKSGGAEVKRKKKNKRRTFKFRAWLYENEEMKVLKKVDFARFEEDKLFKQMHLMPFTGVFDSQGNEIFEGDVVIDLTKAKKALYRILYQDGAYILTSWPDNYEPPMNFKGYFDEYFQPNLSPLEKKRKLRLEIIGHIYESLDVLTSRMEEKFQTLLNPEEPSN